MSERKSVTWENLLAIFEGVATTRVTDPVFWTQQVWDALPATPPASETERMHVGPPGWDSTAMRPTHVTVTESASETVGAALTDEAVASMLRAIDGGTDTAINPYTREEANLIRAFVAREAAIRADSGAGLDDEVRREVVRIVGNGETWAREYAYRVLAPLVARLSADREEER